MNETQAPPQQSDQEGLIKKPKGLKELLDDVNIKKNFEEMLGRDARAFQSNILTVYNGSKALQECDPKSIIAAAAISASVNLSILPSLGQSCIVPYRDGDRTVAQWQIMWKGIVQLAHRTGLYRRVHLAHVYEGQLVSYDEFRGIVVLDATKKKSERVEGYYFYFELTNGYTHEAYWPARKCVAHGLRYSKSFQRGNGRWAEEPNFKAGMPKWDGFLTEGSGADAMALKTVVKNELNKWGPLETRVRELVAKDQAAVEPDGSTRYVDTTLADNGEETPGGGEATVPMPKPKELPAPKEQPAKAGPGSSQPVDAEVPVSATFRVASGATTDLNGNKVYVIRTDEDTPRKFYTADEAIFNAAKKSKADKKEMEVYFEEREAAGVKYLWATSLAKDL